MDIRSLSRRTVTVSTVVGLSVAATVGVASTSSANPTAPNPGDGRKAVAAAPAWTAQAAQVGAPDAAAPQTFVVSLATDQAAAQAYVQSLTDPSSPNYKKYLTPAQYAQKFGADAATVGQATSWLSSQGLTVNADDADKGYLSVTGSTDSVNKAFGTQLNTYKHGNDVVTAPSAALTVPTSVTSITGVTGLDTTPKHAKPVTTEDISNQAARAYAKAHGITLPDNAQPTGHSGSETGTGCSSYTGQEVAPYQDGAPAPFNTQQVPDSFCGFTPAALNKAQGLDKVHQTGKGVTVGITLWCDAPTIVSDTNRWASEVGAQPLTDGQLTELQPSQPYDPYCAGQGKSDYTETALDVQAIHGAAPDAKIVYSAATAPDDGALVDALHRLVDGNSVDVISDSWGDQEAYIDDTTKAAYDAVFTQAAAQGISVLFSSGDNGDGDKGDGNGAQPDFPATDPWITSVGGTSILTDHNGKTAQTTGWVTTTAAKAGAWSPWSFSYGGGGGVSKLFPQPDYQKNVVPAALAGATPMRVYPDLANVADPNTGYVIGYTDLLNNFTTEKIGGTSLASPRTAGQLALAIEQNGGRRLGFLNPTLYSSAAKNGLTDLSDNTPLPASYKLDDSLSFFGLPALPEVNTYNGQSLAHQSLSLAPGYDNLSGQGAITDQSAFATMVTGG